MKKFDLILLTVFNEHKVINISGALSVSQLLDLLPSDEKRKSYSTVYRHLQTLQRIGYIQCGLIDGLASTWYLTSLGQRMYETHYK